MKRVLQGDAKGPGNIRCILHFLLAHNEVSIVFKLIHMDSVSSPDCQFFHRFSTWLVLSSMKIKPPKKGGASSGKK